MKQLRIEDEMTGNNRIGATSTNLAGLARTFLIAMFIGIILAGVFFAITADVAKVIGTSAQLK